MKEVEIKLRKVMEKVTNINCVLEKIQTLANELDQQLRNNPGIAGDLEVSSKLYFFKDFALDFLGIEIFQGIIA